ncbi:MAG: molybdopterin-dependent oxidoreductase, partial [Coriobacteriia bacterium]|nr:molybdopterin-dependent oxidoreductase [Coriobacteriia bacterium]
MTNHYTDMQNSDVFIVCGSNNAENHPISMLHINRAREKGAKLVVIDPRFTRTAAVADAYYPMRPGTDIALFGGIINYLLQNDAYNQSYVADYTNASYLVDDSYSFSEGMFSGYTGQDGPAAYDRASWSYQIEGTTQWDTSESGTYAWVAGEGVPEFTTPAVPIVKKDPSMQDPNCVMQLMKAHYARYTPEMVSRTVGMSVEQFAEVCEIYASTADDSRSLNWLYAMGITQHTKGSQNVRAKSIIQLLLGNMGIAGGGIAALRGKCNIQGSTDFGLLHNILPGYNPVPSEGATPTLRAYNEGTAHSGFWANRPRFIVSKLKAFWGEHATLENDFCFDYLPKLGSQTNYSFMEMFEQMHAGKIKGLFAWGMNPVVGGPNSNRTRAGLAQLDWLVSVDVFENDTSNFWAEPLVEGGEATPEDITTEVFLLPAQSHLESEGTITNSGRWAQWRFAKVDGKGDTKRDGDIMTGLLRAYQAEYASGGVFPDPILKLSWNYLDAEGKFDSRLVAKEVNGYQIADGQHLAGFGQLQANGSTVCLNWIYSGYYNNSAAPLDPASQPCGARDASDATVSGLSGGLKQYPGWAFAWPLNRRIVYNRASTHKDSGLARNPEKILVQWNGS